ncbi:acyltransferase [Listeria aquatica]|uniref:acyltransferase n=1 Tax=Listeria aquatica TaxID=1494960 RepID=UPI0031F4B2F5
MELKLFVRYVLPMHLVQLITGILPNTDVTSRIRGNMMRPFFKKCEPGFRIGVRNIINRPDKIEIGKNVYISHHCYLNGTGGLKIEKDCMVGPMSVIVTSKHLYEQGKVQQKSVPSSVIIKQGSWLASHVVINAGVVIESGVTVAAGAIVLKSAPKDTIIGGVPAKVIKEQEKGS